MSVPHPDDAANRDLGLLIVGNTVSAFGSAVYLIAVTLLLKELTGSALMLGLFQFAALAPGFLLSPLTGVIVDRGSRRWIIIGTDIYRGVLMLLAGAALSVPALRTSRLVLTIAFLAGIGQALFVPAVHALLPALVHRSRLQSATGLRAAGSQLGNLGGSAAGGALFALLGAPLLFVVNGLSFLASAAQELFIRGGRDRAVPIRTASIPEMVRDGLRTVARDRQLRALMCSQAGLFLVSPVLIISLPFLVIDDLGMSEAALGVYLALALAGGVASFAVMRRIEAQAMLRLPVVGSAYLALSLAFAAAGVAPSSVVLAIVAVCAGAAAGGVYLFTTTWIQLKSEPGLYGRIFAVLEGASSALAPTGYLAAGVLLELLGAGRRWVLFLIVAGGALVWAMYLLVKPGRGADRS